MTAQADVINDWNVEALNAMRGNRTPPPKASRSLAMLHATMDDAVNGLYQLEASLAREQCVSSLKTSNLSN